MIVGVAGSLSILARSWPMITRREDDDRRRGELARLDEDLPAIDVGEAEIEHDDVGRRIGDEAQSLAPCPGVQHLVAGRLQRRAQETHDLRLVVDDEDAERRHARSCASAGAATRGNWMTMRVPRRRTAGLSAWIWPPIASMRPLQIDRPRPVPALPPSPRP